MISCFYVAVSDNCCIIQLACYITFVDEKQSGRYIAKRQTYVLIMTVILSLTGGRLLDKVSGQYIGFAILFVLINCDSFTVVYMMRYLCLSYTAATEMQMIISLVQLWGSHLFWDRL